MVPFQLPGFLASGFQLRTAPCSDHHCNAQDEATVHAHMLQSIKCSDVFVACMLAPSFDSSKEQDCRVCSHEEHDQNQHENVQDGAKRSLNCNKKM